MLFHMLSNILKKYIVDMNANKAANAYTYQSIGYSKVAPGDPNIELASQI